MPGHREGIHLQAAIQAVVGEAGAVEAVISAVEGEAEVAVAAIEVIDAEADSSWGAAAAKAARPTKVKKLNNCILKMLRNGLVERAQNF